MAGNYDIFSCQERARQIALVKNQLNLATRSNSYLSSLWAATMANRNIVAWSDVLTDVVTQLAIIKSQVVAAQDVIDNLLAADGSVYPKFIFDYEWIVGRGGISEIQLGGGGGQELIFYGVNGVSISSIVPSTIITTSSLLLLSGFNIAANNRVFTITALTSSGFDLSETITTGDEACTNVGASVKLIRVNVP